MLTVPITVVPDVPFVEFDDVALIEQGDPGSVFGDSNFWDYVVVEGTKDGCTWLPVADGYDARLHPGWAPACDACPETTPADASLLRHQTFDLTQTFVPGDAILLRFRLFADQLCNCWGWVIDNLEIQVGTASAAPATLPQSLALLQNSPNPFREGTAIAFALPRGGLVELGVYDVAGRLVQNLVEGPLPAGRHSVRFEQPGLAAGVYFYRLSTESGVQSRKMVVLR